LGAAAATGGDGIEVTAATTGVAIVEFGVGDGAVVVETAVAVMISVGNVDTVVTCVLVVLTVAVFNAISAVLVTKAGGGVDFKEAVCKADVVTVGLFCGLIGAAFSDATEVGTGTVATTVTTT